MKKLGFIIFVLATTLFVACDKKGGGSSSRNCSYNAYGRYGYNNCAAVPGYQMRQQSGCRGALPIFSDLYAYCSWLATDGESYCNPALVRSTFMAQCRQYTSSMNYCNTASSSTYSGGGSYTYRSRDDDGYYDFDNGTQISTKEVGTVKYYGKSRWSERDDRSAEYYDRNQDRTVQVTPAPVAKTTPVAPATTTAAVQNDNTAKQPVATAYALNDNTGGEKTTITELPPVKVSAKVASSSVRYDIPGLDLAKCPNLQQIHEWMLNPENKLSSYSAFYTIQPKAKNHSKEWLAQWISSMDAHFSNYHGSVWDKADNLNLSAMGRNFKQKDYEISFDNSTGIIVRCEDNKFLAAKMKTEDGVEYTVGFSWNGFWDAKTFEVHETISGQYTDGKESDGYTIARLIGVGTQMSEADIYKSVKARGHQDFNKMIGSQAMTRFEASSAEDNRDQILQKTSN
jgi:hypothetical protein